MTVTLPFEFDTRAEVKTILQGVLGLLLVVVVPGILYSLFVSRNRAAAFALLAVGALTMYFGTLFWKHLRGAAGTITADAVVLYQGRLFGIPLPGPAGRVPIDRFKAVRVERIAPPVERYGQGQERVSLVGKDSMPDIIIARAATDAGRAMGHQLAAALNLPFEDHLAPY